MNAMLKLPFPIPTLEEPEVPEGFELSRGRLVEKLSSCGSDWVTGQIIMALGQFCRVSKLGWVFPETVYRCFPRPRKAVRKPDASVILRGRLPNIQRGNGDLFIPPDLVVEVISPNDKVYDLEEKIEDYLAVQVPLIWIVNPNSRSVYVYRLNHPLARLTDQDELSGEDILPGFRCRIAEILPEPELETVPPETSEAT